MPSSPPRFLFFDLGNVLLSFDPRRLTRQVSAVSHVAPQNVWRVLFETDLYAEYECGRISSEAVHAAFLRQTAADVDFATFHAAACQAFEPMESALSLVERLHEAGHRLGVLSNTNAGHWRYICGGQYPTVTRCFEQYALSFQLGVMKPDPAIYAAAGRLARVVPASIFFVDDRAENVASARAAGWDAVQYTDSVQLADALRQRGVHWSE